MQQIAAGNGSFTVSPNPNKGSFTIDGRTTSNAVELVTITVTDVLGQAIYSQQAETGNGYFSRLVQLDNSIANGMYLVTITSGQDRIVFHIVVEK